MEKLRRSYVRIKKEYPEALICLGDADVIARNPGYPNAGRMKLYKFARIQKIVKEAKT
ncbi:MAG: hypothetical protein AAB875_05140 [Patescibacteria group bacterium]